VATELADNPGASVTNAAEGLAAQAWHQFQPQVASPPFLVEHYGQASYDHVPADEPDRFAWVEFAVYTWRGGAASRASVAAPRWSHITPALVRALTGQVVR
jgi:hypothetical protein